MKSWTLRVGSLEVSTRITQSHIWQTKQLTKPGMSLAGAA